MVIHPRKIKVNIYSEIVHCEKKKKINEILESCFIFEKTVFKKNIFNPIFSIYLSRISDLGTPAAHAP